MKLFPITNLWQWGFRDAMMDSVEPLRGWPPKLDGMSQEYREGYASGCADAEAKANMPALGASWDDLDREASLQAVKALVCSECWRGIEPDERTDFMGRTVCEGCNDYLQREHEACMMEHEAEMRSDALASSRERNQQGVSK